MQSTEPDLLFDPQILLNAAHAHLYCLFFRSPLESLRYDFFVCLTSPPPFISRRNNNVSDALEARNKEEKYKQRFLFKSQKQLVMAN